MSKPQDSEDEPIIEHTEGDCHACIVNPAEDGHRYCTSCKEALLA